MTQIMAPEREDVSLDGLAGLCKAAADPLRLSILRVLRGESYGVQELTYIFDMIQSGMSHHLKVLARAGLVATRKEGTFVFYRRPLLHGDLQELKKGLLATIDATPVPEEIAERMAAIRAERDTASQLFFDKNADRLQQQQDMIVTYSVYAGSLDELLASAHIPSDATVLEVGPGKGELLKRLASQFKDLHALDSSREMLAKTREALGDIPHIQFHHGTLDEACNSGLRVDFLVLNMVLHHISSPGAAFLTFGRLLNPGGTLLVADLNPHAQSWVAEACGDLWQGFEPEQLTQWAGLADLREGGRMFLGLKNGFRVQMRLFHKH